MSATVWYGIGIAGFVLAICFFIFDVILFFLLRIPTIFTELSGRRFEKEMKLIREANVKEGRKNRVIPKKLQPKEMEYINPAGTMPKSYSMDTDEDNTSILSYDTTETMVLSNKTSVLSDTGQTEILDSDAQFQIIRDIIILHTEERIV